MRTTDVFPEPGGPCGAVVERDNPSHVAGEIDDQPSSQRSAGQTGAAPPCVQRNLVRRGVAHRRRHVVHRPRSHNAQRSDLVDARVAGVELHEQIVAANFAGNLSAQIRFDALSFDIHRNVGWGRGSKGGGIVMTNDEIPNDEGMSND